jgi:hypothetical protein
MTALVEQREELERRVNGLRTFEYGYRSRLKAYLEDQLRTSTRAPLPAMNS